MSEIKISKKQLRRVLPPVIEEAIENGFNVIVTKNGYFIEGFYGLNNDSVVLSNFGEKIEPSFIGMCFLTDSEKEDILIAFDHKGKKQEIKNFDDLVFFNNHVWKFFVKEDKYRVVNKKWFNYLYEKGLLDISPKK